MVSLQEKQLFEAIIARNMLNCLPSSFMSLQKSGIDITKETITSVAGFPIN